LGEEGVVVVSAQTRKEKEREKREEKERGKCPLSCLSFRVKEREREVEGQRWNERGPCHECMCQKFRRVQNGVVVVMMVSHKGMVSPPKIREGSVPSYHDGV
jgi:hypothetical protein